MTGIALTMAEDWIASKRQELKDIEADVVFMRREIIDAERGEGSILTHIRQWAEDARPRYTTRRAPWRLPTATAYRHDICDKCQGSGVHSHTDSGEWCIACGGSGGAEVNPNARTTHD